MRFVDIHTCKLLFRMGSHEDAITAVTVSPNGRHVVAIMDNGSVNIYRVLSLTQELNKVTAVRKCFNIISCFFEGYKLISQSI